MASAPLAPADRSAPAAPPAGQRRERRYFPELESLRGIAISQVFAMHSSGWILGGLAGSSSLLVALVMSDRLGVDLFFVLSAFLLSLPFLEDAAGGPRVPVRRYFERRVLRILPAYYVAVVVGTVLTARQLRDLLRGLPYLVFLNPLAVPLRPYSDVWWSLTTEAQFYVVLPLLGILGRSTAGRRLGIAFVLVWAACYVAFLRGVLGPRSFASLSILEGSLFGRAPFFLAGVAAAAVYRAHGATLIARLEAARFMRAGGGDLLLLLLLLGIAAFARWELAIGHGARWEPRYQDRDLVTAVLIAAVLLLLVLAPLRAKRLLVNPLLGGLGVISYSVYLIHLPLMVFLTSYGPLARMVASVPDVRLQMALRFVIVAAACVAVSTLTYRVIERPFLLRKSKL